MDLQEVEWRGMDRTDRAQGRDRWRVLVSEVMNLWLPLYARTFLTSCKSVNFLVRILLYGIGWLVGWLVG